MLRDRYPPVDLFALVPALALQFEPVLARLDHLLEDDTLFHAVRADLARRRPQTLTTGRPSTPVEVILRLLIVRRLYGWSYAETEQFVSDSLILRQFCRLGLERAPDDTTLVRWVALLQPQTLQTLLDHVVGLARQLQVTRGRKLRVDSTAVATPVHYPTDARLLGDGVRILGRLVRRARPLAGTALSGVRDAFRSRVRSARACVQAMHRLARVRTPAGEAKRQGIYRRLLRITRQAVRQAARVEAGLSTVPSAATAAGQRLQQELTRVRPLVEQVIAQASRRVFAGDVVPAAEKVLSLVEPHTAIIPQQKPGRPVAFGHKVWLAETEGGILTDVQVMVGASIDAPQVLPTLARHERQFGRPPTLLTADRGCSTAAVRQGAVAAGVRHVAILSRGGPPLTQQLRAQPRWFRRAYRWRAGIEGRIGILKARFGFDRCRDHGERGFERWVLVGALVANLQTIARATAAR